MNTISHRRNYLLKNVVRRLCFFIAWLSSCFIFVSRSGVLSAQENLSLSKSVRSESVQPIQRKTASFTKAASKATVPAVPKVDWTTLPSTYTHAPDGQRVYQFVEVTPEPIFEIPANSRSGYRHTRSTLQAGFSSDNYHSVEQWGAPVRPYGEWRYPNRPFAVPYGAWGPQLPQVVGGGFGFFPGPYPHQFPINPQQPPSGGPVGSNNIPGGGWGGGPMFGPSYHGYPPFGMSPFGVGPQNGLAPTQDDYYPQAPMLQSPHYHSLRNGLEQSHFLCLFDPLNERLTRC